MMFALGCSKDCGRIMRLGTRSVVEDKCRVCRLRTCNLPDTELFVAWNINGNEINIVREARKGESVALAGATIV